MVKVVPPKTGACAPGAAYNRSFRRLDSALAAQSYPEDVGLSQSKSGDDIATHRILTAEEISTLHLLFGSEKPGEMSFYGRNRLQSIHKGRFIDLKA